MAVPKSCCCQSSPCSQARRGGSGCTLPRGPVYWRGVQISGSFEVFSNLTRKMFTFFDFGVDDQSRQNFWQEKQQFFSENGLKTFRPTFWLKNLAFLARGSRFCRQLRDPPQLSTPLHAVNQLVWLHAQRPLRGGVGTRSSHSIHCGSQAVGFQ